ncbi:MAG: hypothetical protein R2688_02375 [Fimbriimonadaceae bacterium]
MKDIPVGIEPCSHMRDTVVGMAGGNLRGWRALYAKLHVPRCAKCRAFLNAIKQYFATVESVAKTEEAQPEMAWDNIEERWDAIDAKGPPNES